MQTKLVVRMSSSEQHARVVNLCTELILASTTLQRQMAKFLRKQGASDKRNKKQNMVHDTQTPFCSDHLFSS